MIHYQRVGRIYSIDRVRSELLAGRKTEDLVLWVKNDVPDGFFLDTDNEEVAAAYTDVMLWVQRRPLYFDYAKAKFATGADGWLVAYARIHGAVIVTNEQPAPESKRRSSFPTSARSSASLM